MANETTTTTTTSDVLGAIVELLKTGADPDVLEAQKILLRRIALEGDVVPSRAPAPRNITEVGGYLNLLSTLDQPELSAQMLAGILGVAGPNPPLGWIPAAPAISFVSIANDRPAGAAQAAIPVNITIRSDLLDTFRAAIKSLRDLGCMLPLLTPARALPQAILDQPPPDDLLSLLGRAFDVVPAAILADPDNDPLALARLTTDPPNTFQLVARELDGGTLVAEQPWAAQRCDATSCATTPPAMRRYQPIAPLLIRAGWYPPQPAILPANLTKQGNLTRLINVTGLVAGVTRLGDELSLLYPQNMILTSSLAARLQWVWSGTSFVASS